MLKKFRSSRTNKSLPPTMNCIEQAPSLPSHAFSVSRDSAHPYKVSEESNPEVSSNFWRSEGDLDCRVSLPSAKPLSLVQYFGSPLSSHDFTVSAHESFSASTPWNSVTDFPPSPNESSPYTPIPPTQFDVHTSPESLINPQSNHHQYSCCGSQPGDADDSTLACRPGFGDPRNEEASELNLDPEKFANTPTATSEKMLQLSQQLSGILQTSGQLTMSMTSSVGNLSPQCHERNTPSSYFSGSGTFSPPLGSPSTQMAEESSPGVTSRNNKLFQSAAMPFKRSTTPTSVHSASHTNTYVRELEDRNVELAALLERRTRAYERALAKLQTVQEQSARAASNAAVEKTNLEQSASRDLSRAHEQIRAHAQAVGALVAEKNELQAKVEQLERIAQERAQELNVVAERLQNSRQQSVDLKRAIATLNSNLEQATKGNADLSAQLERARSETERERSSRENVEAELQEAYSRLNSRVHEVSKLESDLRELKQSLELAQICSAYTGQFDLSASGPEDTTRDLKGSISGVDGLSRVGWIAERSSFISRIHELENTALQARKDHGHLESQYKMLVAQVEQQVVELRSELSNANKANHELQLSLDEAQRLIREKENELAKLKSPAIHVEPTPVELLPKHDQLASVDDLQRIVSQQQDDLERQVHEMVSLKEQLAYAQEMLREKDTILADRQSILDAATSERVTLSRAMEQNRSLKQQLSELQDAFVSTSNKNVELAAELQNEKNASKERNTADEIYRGQLERLQEHCARREADYAALNQAYQIMSSDLIQAGNRIAELELIQNSCIDAAAHLHEGGPHHSCSDELNPYGAVSDKVVVESDEKESTSVAINHRLDLLDCLVHQLQVSFNWLLEQKTTLDTVAHKPKTDDPMELFSRWDRLMRSLIAERDKAVAVQAEQNRRHTTHIEQLPKVEEWQALQAAHLQLESKFNECMEKLSSASEERFRLEGIVAQLEMEAATVGEYVTLFAHRRAAAARRAQSREQLLERFVQDRKNLRSRLKAMKELVPRSLDSDASSDGSPLKSTGEQLQHEFVSQFRRLLDEVGSTEDEAKTESGFHLLNDEDAVAECTAEPSEMTALKCVSNSHTYTTLELLRRQALQHDCPHCQCCVGTLLEV